MTELAFYNTDGRVVLPIIGKIKKYSASFQIGARVELLGTCGSWKKVKFGSRIGYMMTKFLTSEETSEPDEDLSLEERITRLERKVLPSLKRKTVL